MSKADRAVRQQRNQAEQDARTSAHREQRSGAIERARLESQIRWLIPQVLSLLERTGASKAEAITYGRLRVPWLGGLFGRRQTTTASWKIAEWMPPRDRLLHQGIPLPVWLVSNGQIGTLGRGGALVYPVTKIGGRSPQLLRIAYEGLLKRNAELTQTAP